MGGIVQDDYGHPVIWDLKCKKLAEAGKRGLSHAQRSVQHRRCNTTIMMYLLSDDEGLDRVPYGFEV